LPTAAAYGGLPRPRFKPLFFMSNQHIELGHIEARRPRRFSRSNPLTKCVHNFPQLLRSARQTQYLNKNGAVEVRLDGMETYMHGAPCGRVALAALINILVVEADWHIFEPLNARIIASSEGRFSQSAQFVRIHDVADKKQTAIVVVVRFSCVDFPFQITKKKRNA
jgi:hypothetical protein